MLQGVLLSDLLAGTFRRERMRMTTVYILLKHPPYPYNASKYLSAGELHGVFEDKKEAERVADEKNSRKPHGLYAVHTKRLKAAAGITPDRQHVQGLHVPQANQEADRRPGAPA